MTYSAALHLTMAKTLFPSSTQDRLYSQNAHAILDELILWGNRVAASRKQELSRIEGLFQELARRVEQEGLRLLSLSGSIFSDTTPSNIPPEAQVGEVSVADTGTVLPTSFQDGQSIPADPPATASLDFLESIGISSFEFHSIINQINNPEISYGDLDMGPNWLAGGNTTDSFS